MAVDRWRLDNNFGKLRKEDLPALLQTAVDTLDPKSILPNGFKTCGLYPFSPEAVNYNVLKKKKNSIDIDDKLTFNEKPTSSNCSTNHLAIAVLKRATFYPVKFVMKDFLTLG